MQLPAFWIKMASNPKKAKNDKADSSARLAPVKKLLHIEMIVNKVASHLKPKELTALRRTCTMWNRSFTPELRNKHKEIHLNGGRKLQNFTADMKTSKQTPYSNFRISGILIRSQNFEEFMVVVGPSIRSLALEVGDHRASLNLYDVRRAIFDWTPGLTELKLQLQLYGDGVRWRSSNICAARRLPHLTRLELDYYDSTNPDTPVLINDIIKNSIGLTQFSSQAYLANKGALPALRDLALNLDKLQCLDIYAAGRNDLAILCVMGRRNLKPLRLKLINLSVPERDAHPLLNTFLATQAPTLEELNLLAKGGGVQLPRMPVLHTLRLGNYGSHWLQGMELEGGTLANNFPALKTFVLDNHGDEWKPGVTVVSENIGAEPHTGVKDLTLRLALDGPSLKKLTSAFPVLRNINIAFPGILQDKTPARQAIWTTWQELQTLTLQDIDLTRVEEQEELDEYLSGIPKARLAECRRKLATSTEGENAPDLVALRAVVDEYKVHPGLGDLKHLQLLTICAANDQTADYARALIGAGDSFGLAISSRTLQHIEITRDAPGWICWSVKKHPYTGMDHAYW